MLPPSVLTWDLTEASLLALAATDLDAGQLPAPRLASFAGDEPLSLARLRPFGPGEVLHALIELLALMLPLGADRLALALPGRGWPVGAPPDRLMDGDAGHELVVVSCADGHRRRPACLTTSLHPFRLDPDGWRWGDRVDVPERPEGEVAAALTTLLDARDEVDGDRLVAQFGRVLLLGHELALAPGAATRLDVACTPPPDDG